MRQLLATSIVLTLACGGPVSHEPDSSLAPDAGSAVPSDSGRPASDSGPRQVSACPDITPGEWAEITPPGINLDRANGFGADSIAVDPFDSARVYFGTDHQGFYRSEDCGSTWTRIATGRNGDIFDQGAPWSIYLDPEERDVIYTVSGYGPSGLWKSVDAGTNWDQILSSEVLGTFYNGGFIQMIAPDPTDHLHMLVSPHFSCSGEHAPNCFAETFDGGQTWSIVDNAPAAGEGTGMMILSRDTWLYALSFGGLLRTTDHGAHWTQMTATDSYAFGNIARGPDGDLYVPAAFGILHAPPDGSSWEQIPSSWGAFVLTASATHLYASSGYCVAIGDPFQPFGSASFDDLEHWTRLDSPAIVSGSAWMQYDSDHHLLYASDCNAGVYRGQVD